MRSGAGRRFAANDGDAVPDGKGVHAVVDSADAPGVELARQADGDQGAGRGAGHGGDVAQAARERLVADFFSGGVSMVKWIPSTMASVLKSSIGPARPHRGRRNHRPRHDDGGVARQAGSEEVDEVELLHGLESGLKPNIRKRKFAKLNSAWVMKGARMLPVC